MITSDRAQITSKTISELTGIENKESNYEKLKAKFAAGPVANSSSVILNYSDIAELDFAALLSELVHEGKMVSDKDSTRHGEMLLVSQATALDAIFAHLAVKAKSYLDQSPKMAESILKLALKAQAQTRCTWETIGKLKNPPNVSFVKQANIANGHQQVNNYPHQSMRTENIGNAPNELLEQENAERLDTSTAGEAIRSDKRLETMGVVDRTKKP